MDYMDYLITGVSEKLVGRSFALVGDMPGVVDAFYH